MPVLRLDHVQLAMPAAREAEARAFYGELLGLDERPRPAALDGRGGCWFESGELKLHLGVDPAFAPARKAHPALVVSGLDALVETLAAGGHPSVGDTALPGIERCFVHDPFGNRIELMEFTQDGAASREIGR